jgi:hypothetical protein
VSTGAETIVHAPWCEHEDDEEPRHECNASLSVDLSRYPPEPQRSGDWQHNVGALTVPPRR